MTHSSNHDQDPSEHCSAVSRRRVVQAGAVVGGAVAMGVHAGAPANASPAGVRRETSFDADWRFFRGPVDKAQAPGFDDARWRRLDLPHDYSIDDLAGGSNDGAATKDPTDSILFTTVLNPILNGAAPTKIGPFDTAQTPGGTFPPTSSGKQVGWTTNGEAWYRKHFTVDRRDRDRVELRFDGVYANSDVWLNGVHLGFVANGYVPFSYDLTPHLKPGMGQNVLAVRVRNLGKNSRFYAGSGISRHTSIVVTSPVRIPRWGVQVVTTQATAARADVLAKIIVDNHAGTVENVRVRASVLSPSGRTIVTRETRLGSVGVRRTVTTKLVVPRPALWDLDTPHLHTLKVQVFQGATVVDEVTEEFGIRSIRADDTGFFLNGRSIKLRGGNIHSDHGPLGAVALYRSGERRVQLLKEVGFNALRMAHNCPDPGLLTACDRLGMLVMDEFSDMWNVNKNDQDYSLQFTEHWRDDVARWVLSGLNHPSVIIRSIGNEIPTLPGGIPLPVPVVGQAERAALGQRIADHVRSIDPTRPLCQGGAQGMFLGTDTSQGDHIDIGDVHYLRDYANLPDVYPGKAFLQSESFPATMYDDWKLVTDHAYAIGDFTWTAYDYLGEAGTGAALSFPIGTEPVIDPVDPVTGLLLVAGIAGYPWFTAHVSDLDLIGQRRPQSLYRSVVWGLSDLEMAVDRPNIPGFETQAFAWSWYDELESWTWNVAPSHPMRVHVYTTADTVDLFLDGERIDSSILTESNKRMATFTVPYRPGALVAVAKTNGREVARKTLRTTGAPAALRLTPDRSRITTSRDDLAHVLVEVVDRAGDVVPDAVVKAEFGVAGGTLVAVGNGNAHNVDSFQRPRRWTYHGQALAIIRPPTRPGRIQVSAWSTGLQGDSVSINVVNAPYPGK